MATPGSGGGADAKNSLSAPIATGSSVGDTSKLPLSHSNSGQQTSLVQIGHYVLGETLGIGTFGKVKGNRLGMTPHCQPLSQFFVTASKN